ncbi:hypothetical protein FQR65_LT09409 [Abscondita terminalis]|nr:hypothetical protein FQR65_LT09409 [Abscondita terminalis]
MVVSMERWKGTVAVVTGASGGIATEIVKKLLENGVIVVGMSRQKEVVQNISSSNDLHSLRVDLRNEDEILTALDWVKKTIGPIHILINCATTFWCTSTVYGETKLWKDTFDTEIFGLLVPTKEVVKQMISNHINGHVIHISGLCGHGVYIPNAYAITACKTAVTSMTESLRRELIDLNSKIKISNIAPGVTKTDIFKKNISDQPELGEYIKKANFEVFLDASDVADAVIYVLSTPPHVQVEYFD